MILTIKGADFSSANIGTLNTYVVSKSIGSGVSHNIPNYVEKNTSVEWTLTIAEGYTLGTYSITMGGETVTPVINDYIMTITIPDITGNIRISIATINENTGEEDSGNTPSTPVVPTLYSSPVGYQLFEFGDFKIIANNTTINTFKTNIYGIDVSNYIGKEITISAEQSYVKNNDQLGDAYYNFFTSDAINGIKPEDLGNIDSQSFVIGSDNSKTLVLDKSVIVERFDVPTEATATTYVSKTVTVPTGAKYLYFTSCKQNTTQNGKVIFN